MPFLIVFLFIALLILINALYVAAEFSAVSTRPARLSQLVDEGNQMAAYLMDVVEDPHKLDTYVAACQLGITVSSLMLGFYGQAQLAPLVTPLLSDLGNIAELAAQSISATVVLLLLTGLQVLLGELVPKNIGIRYPERLGMATSVPMQWSIAIFRPLIWLFNGSGQLLMRLFGQDVIGEHAHIHAPEEILMLVDESGAGGLLQREEHRLLKNTLQLRDALVRQVMIPRTYMLTASENLKSRELFKLLADSRYSRIPIYRNNIDNIVGVVHLKDLLCLGETGRDLPISEIMHPVPLVPETMLVKTVFSLLQRKHLHIAVVLDEFGGTAGMVTLEDLIEEIFGELQDEFDAYIPPVRVVPGNRVWLRGDTLISDINDWMDINLADDEVDTIGGLVLNVLGHVPGIGEEVRIQGLEFRVEKMKGRGVTAVSLAANDDQIRKAEEGLS
jgi:CBS domain containing-hemolysin-like protein